MDGNSLAVQWLGLSALTAVGLGLILGQGTKIPPTTRHGNKKKKKSRALFHLWEYEDLFFPYSHFIFLTLGVRKKDKLDVFLG